MNDNPLWNTPIQLRIGDPASVTSNVPHLLGFYPQDSLVLVTVTAGDPPRLGVTVRIDLPPPQYYELTARSLLQPLIINDVVSATLVLVGSSRHDPNTPPGGWTEPSKDGLPHRSLVDALTAALADAEIDVVRAVWTPRIETGQRWWCYEDPSCTGELPDVRSTALAMASAVSGDVTLRDRDELVVMLEPVPSDTLRRTEAALEARAHLAPNTNTAAAVQLFMDAMANTHELTQPDGADHVADLIAALRPPAVRTVCMGMALDDRAHDAERLWIALTKATPGPWRAEPACLLAVSAYAQGKGVLARAAVDVALDADPHHGLASVLDQALRMGLPRRKVLAILAETTTESASGDARTDDVG
ncbi:DUF4192 domain-containing protein [Labedaea rhizosphaerae]|uniref:Uncharacterized protein DUF4192 n=1 Tax=Labedaea rhizosphaerae TaxID=598644 RepID=A0A4R6SGE5_LABRH|nr:DUF4192 domain-containing protein [Labedaea rhizosphaerae]TDQ00617.1 uncharacterized protein DUF4192 [Labedaea rhizosphaerae]